MPFTPFHFGPGLLIKSAAPLRVSVAAYATANVVIDVETVYHLVRHDATVHQWAHTFLGAGLVGIAVGALIAVAALRVGTGNRIVRTAFDGEVAAIPILLGAFLGAIAHPLLDGLMHPDIHPFRPFSDANPLRGLVSLSVLQASCLAAGGLGAAILFARRATWAAVACLLLMAPTATRVDIAANYPMRLGDMARGLPDAEVVDLDGVASAHGVSSWLISGPRGQFADMQTIEAFGAPTASTPALRRGPVVIVARRRASIDARWQPWALESKNEYAQVAVRGEAFGWIEDDRDLIRPFRLRGRFTNDDINTIVALIRSSPAGPGPSGVARVHGSWPIFFISREKDGAIEVMLHEEGVTGQLVTLRMQDGAWVVASVTFSVL